MRKYIKNPDLLRAVLLTLLNGISSLILSPILFIGLLWSIESSVLEDSFFIVLLLITILIVPLLIGFLLVNRLKWWLISLPVQFCLIFGAAAILSEYHLLFAALYTILPLAAQAAGAVLGILYRKPSENRLRQSVIRASLLTLLHGLYVVHSTLILLTASAYVWNYTQNPSLLFDCLFCLGIPVLLAMIAVDRPSWWLASLPVQLIADSILLKTVNDFDVRVLPAVLFFLMLQAIGVGIGLLIRRVKAFRRSAGNIRIWTIDRGE